METPKQIPETFSVGQAFHINIYFLLGIWPLVKPKVIEEQKSGLYSFFFLEIYSTYDCHLSGMKQYIAYCMFQKKNRSFYSFPYLKFSPAL